MALRVWSYPFTCMLHVHLLEIFCSATICLISLSFLRLMDEFMCSVQNSVFTFFFVMWNHLQSSFIVFVTISVILMEAWSIEKMWFSTAIFFIVVFLKSYYRGFGEDGNLRYHNIHILTCKVKKASFFLICRNY